MYYKVVSAQDICHHGIKGMKWGVRRYQNKDGSLTAAGKKRYNADDISDDELRSRINRMNKERAYHQTAAEIARLQQGPSKVKSALQVAEAAAAAGGGLAKAAAVGNKYKASKTDDAAEKDIYNKRAVRRGQEAALAKEGGNLSKNLGKFAGREKKLPKEDLTNVSDEELNARLNRMNMERSYLQMVSESSSQGKGRDKTIKVLQDVGTVAASAASVASIAMTVKSIMDSRPKKK